MLKIENLTVSVASREVLSDINLWIKNGQVMALLGPNGSGKTSLLMAIMGFSNYKIEKGAIIFKGKRVNDLTINERVRLGLGMMFQRPPAVRGVKIKQMVDLIKRDDFNLEQEALDLDFNEFLNRDTNVGFSGGEIKRSELLQLLACAPSLSLFDEPESGVDLENIALVGKAMKKILDKNRDNAALIITHTGYIFDYVNPDSGSILVGGKLHCAGDPKRILQTVKKHGYEWCITCDGEKLRERSHNPAQ